MKIERFENNSYDAADVHDLFRAYTDVAAALAAVPVESIRHAMADTTAQHYSWYQPIRRWLDSLEAQP